MAECKTCAFTGNRDITGYLNTEALEILIEGLIEEGVITFLSGMARGFDMIAAELIIKIRKEKPHIKLIACVPCPEQDKYFCIEDKNKYKSILEQCDEVRLISDHYFKGCMFLRDRYMVDNADCVIAYERKKTDGGTVYTMNYAKNQNKTIYLI